MNAGSITVKRLDEAIVISFTNMPSSSAERGLLTLFVEMATRSNAPSVVYELSEKDGSLTMSAMMPVESRKVLPVVGGV